MQYKNPSYNKTARPVRRSAKKRLFLLLAIVVAAAGILTALELTDTTHLFHREPVQLTGGPGTKGVDPSESTGSDSDGTSGTDTNAGTSTDPGTPDKTGGATSAKLTAPQGPFVSNHAPNAAHPTINSACSTTSGATCQIIFTNDGVTKSLAAQMTDLGGSTYWNGWKPKDIGLTAGEWKITAKATLGSQTKTATDALPLRVIE